jgi:hypothetical protein
MNHAIAYEHEQLIESFERDETTGIRRRARLSPIVVAVDDPARHPVPIHITVRQGERARRYYVGVRFEAGVIPAHDWEDTMRRDGVGAGAILATRRWLNKHAL